MTPKEKAIELVEKFTFPCWTCDEQSNAKESALIAVDEILFSNNTIFETNIPHECWKYWLEVKKEIQLL